MISRLKCKPIQQLLHHTNQVYPHSEYIGYDRYPEQSELVGTTVTLRYNDHNKIDQSFEPMKLVSWGRPYDDVIDQPRTDDNPDFYDADIAITKDFIILRYDIVAPYVFIAVRTDYALILVGSTLDDQYTKINIPYTEQNVPYIGLECTVKFSLLEDQDRKGYIVRADEGEPFYSVICINVDGKNRYILGDECMGLIPMNKDGGIDLPKIIMKPDERYYIDLIKPIITGENHDN